MPTGFCECGCGERTNVAKQTLRACGHIRGQPMRFVLGHSGRMQPRGPDHPLWKGGRLETPGWYVRVRMPEHPRADSWGCVYEHVLVVEAALGKPLPEGVEIHHVNGDRSDNRPRNLIACESLAYHRLLHVRQRALAACGHAIWRRCNHCGEWDRPSALYSRGTRSWHRACHAEHMRARRRRAG